MGENRIYKFFPFASSRLCSLFKYINRMYENDYKIVDINLDCILVFEKSQKKRDIHIISLQSNIGETEEERNGMI